MKKPAKFGILFGSALGITATLMLYFELPSKNFGFTALMFMFYLFGLLYLIKGFGIWIMEAKE